MLKCFIFYINLLFIFLLVSCDANPYNTSEYHNRKGLEYLNKDKHEDAIKAFKKAVYLQKDSTAQKATYLRNIATAYHNANNKTKSLWYHKKALEYCEPETAMFYIQQGSVHKLNQQLDSAIICYKKVIRLEPYEAAAYNSLGIIYLGDYDPDYQNLEVALRYNKKAATLNDSPLTNQLLARTYLSLYDYEKAEEVLRKLLKRNKNNLDFKYSLAYCLYFQKKNPEAQTLLLEIIESDSTYLDLVGEQFMVNDLLQG